MYVEENSILKSSQESTDLFLTTQQAEEGRASDHADSDSGEAGRGSNPCRESMLKGSQEAGSASDLYSNRSHQRSNSPSFIYVERTPGGYQNFV